VLADDTSNLVHFSVENEPDFVLLRSSVLFIYFFFLCCACLNIFQHTDDPESHMKQLAFAMQKKQQSNNF